MWCYTDSEDARGKVLVATAWPVSEIASSSADFCFRLKFFPRPSSTLHAPPPQGSNSIETSCHQMAARSSLHSRWDITQPAVKFIQQSFEALRTPMPDLTGSFLYGWLPYRKTHCGGAINFRTRLSSQT